MGAFTRLQELQGRSAARKEADLVWALITSNPTMGDGVTLFHATAVPTGHGNLISGGTVINVDNLGIARQKMRIQKGLGQTEHLNLESRYLLVPTTKEQLAIQFTSVNYTPMATAPRRRGFTRGQERWFRLRRRAWTPTAPPRGTWWPIPLRPTPSNTPTWRARRVCTWNPAWDSTLTAWSSSAASTSAPRSSLALFVKNNGA